MATLALEEATDTPTRLSHPVFLAALGGLHVFRALESVRDSLNSHALRSADGSASESLASSSRPVASPGTLDRRQRSQAAFSVTVTEQESDRWMLILDDDRAEEGDGAVTSASSSSSSSAATITCWESIAAQHAASSWRRGPRRVRQQSRPLATQPAAREHPLSWLPSLNLLSLLALPGSEPQPHLAAKTKLVRGGAARHEAQERERQLEAEAERAGPGRGSWIQAATVAAGAASRTLAQVAIHPLDTLKTRMQVSVPAPQLQIWRSVMACPATRARALAAWACPAGARDLLLGLSGAVLGTLPSSAIYFGTEAAVRGWLSRSLQLEEESAPCRLLAAAAAATTSAFVRVPADVIKHRVQAYVYPSVTVAARDILATRGPAGLYAGFGATLLRDAPELVIQFTVYRQLKALLQRTQEGKDAAAASAAAAAAVSTAGGCAASCNGGSAAAAAPCRCPPAGAGGPPCCLAEHLVLGGAAGATAALATTPLDVLKTQMQTGGAASVSGAVAQLMRSGGAGAFFNGLAPRMLQTTICSALFFTCFEASKARLASMASAEKAAAAAAAVVKATAERQAEQQRLAFGLAAAQGKQQPLLPARRRRCGGGSGKRAEAAAVGLWDVRSELHSAAC